jgi:hypothetical protein
MKLSIIAFLAAITVFAAEWSAPAEVRHDDKPVLQYKARWTGEYLVVQAAIQPGWHTFAMDNKIRQQEKLAGRQSLGLEMPTQVRISKGLETSGPWLQSDPKDFSNPDIQWYTWGFENEATFAVKARPSGPGPAAVNVRGQACAESICKNIDVTLSVATEGASADAFESSRLIPVRQ